MNPDEVEFLAEKEEISIVPMFSHSIIHLISGDVGPFRASLPVKVPLWLGVNLKQQRKCKIHPPDWMNVEVLETIREEEKSSKMFTKMPNEHYMVLVKLLLDCAPDDIPRSDEVRTIVKDIWDNRMSKIRSSMDTLVRTDGMYAALDNLTLIEVNSIRPLLPHALDQMYRMKKVNEGIGTASQSQNDTTLSFTLRGSSSSAPPLS